MENKSYYFEINGERFIFCKNQRNSEYSAEYRLMYYDFYFAWMTIGYPRNITEAKKLAKEYLLRN